MPEYFYADRLFNALEREEPAPGMLLVSAPGMASPEFARTVVLIIERDIDGTVGVVLNRRSELAIHTVIPEWHDLVSSPRALYIGGPVMPQAAVAVGVTKNGVDIDHQPHYTRLANKLVHIDLGVSPEVIADDIEGLRIFAGYSGWDTGQLEEEIARGDWYVTPALPSDVIAAGAADLWGDVMRRQPMPLPLFATFPAGHDEL